MADSYRAQRGPLARVWLAATLERKVTKQSLLSASIPQSVEAIVKIEMIPMALRLSGQLLLGVARIYSRKAKYLMDDCTETLSKVKLAFRPGVVDMSIEQQQASKGQLTHQVENTQLNEFDLIYADVAFQDWCVCGLYGIAQIFLRAFCITGKLLSKQSWLRLVTKPRTKSQQRPQTKRSPCQIMITILRQRLNTIEVWTASTSMKVTSASI